MSFNAWTLHLPMTCSVRLKAWTQLSTAKWCALIARLPST